jgi:hypothetical protein
MKDGGPAPPPTTVGSNLVKPVTTLLSFAGSMRPVRMGYAMSPRYRRWPPYTLLALLLAVMLLSGLVPIAAQAATWHHPARVTHFQKGRHNPPLRMQAGPPVGWLTQPIYARITRHQHRLRSAYVPTSATKDLYQARAPPHVAMAPF